MRAAASRACVTGDAAVDSSDADGTGIAGEGARAVTTYAGGETFGDTPAALAPVGGKRKRRRARSSSRPQTAATQRKLAAFNATRAVGTGAAGYSEGHATEGG